ncbi:hypothetical protein WAU_02082, partial [Escherichia coli KTE3]
RQKQKKLIMLPSETMIWQPEFTDKTLSRKPGAVHLTPARGRLGKYLIESDYETIRISSDKFDDENRTGDNKSLPF